MSATRDAASSSLPAGVEAQAQVDAERFFGDGPITAWHAPKTWAEPTPLPRRALWVAAAGCLAVAALVAAVWWTGDDDAPPESLAVAAPADELVDAPPAVPLPERSVETTPPAPATLNITRRGTEWRIEAVGVSRLVAAQRLAQASGSPLFGDIAPLAATRPLHLSWQGRGAAGAWQAVLGPEVSFATQCGAVRCRVWILEVAASGQAPAPTLPAPSIAPPAIAAVDVAAVAAPQSDSADPRIAAHHD